MADINTITERERSAMMQLAIDTTVDQIRRRFGYIKELDPNIDMDMLKSELIKALARRIET